MTGGTPSSPEGRQITPRLIEPPPPVEMPSEFQPRRLGRRAIPVLALLTALGLVVVLAPGLGQVRELLTGADPAWLALAVLFEALTRTGYHEREARRLAQSAFDVFLDERHKVVYFDGALDLLEELARHYRIGALSNGNADVMRLGLERIFAFKFAPADVGARKPAPEMFRAALGHAGIEPAQMVHVGDDPHDDIDGAERLGIPALWVNFSGSDYPSGYRPPTLTVNLLADIPDRLLAYADTRG
jgi:FMN hydrolase / 5-amino-6-(5-phospho-D-ribitylamino)uracil phosphatase